MGFGVHPPPEPIVGESFVRCLALMALAQHQGAGA